MPSTKTHELVNIEYTSGTTEAGRVVQTTHCECSHYSRTTDGESLTACGRESGATFAQGHDAKLKSGLIRAGLNSWDLQQRYFVTTGTTTIETSTWRSLKTGKETTRVVEVPDLEAAHRPTTVTQAAPRFGFSHQVTAGVAAGQALAAKQAAKAAKAAPVEAEPAPTEVRVGRWWKAIQAVTDGQYEYADKAGLTHLVAVDGAITR